MSLINDYFLLYHGCYYESNEALVLDELEEDLLCEVSALVLSTHRKNFPYFCVLSSFNDLIKKITKISLHNIDDLYLLQYHLIKLIEDKTSAHYVTKIHESFKYLQDKELLSMQNCEKLLSLFDPNEFHSFDAIIASNDKDNNKDFLEQKEVLNTFINELMLLGNTPSFITELKVSQDYLNEQKFSVGITGVMNSGKSTLLNVLIGEEILGTSVVPETANLSLLQYSAQPFAKVFYWSKREWEKIVYSAQEFEAIDRFVKESQEAFKDDFDRYIQENGRVDDIKIEDLSLYTSAKSNRSKLIKKIQIGVSLDFLKEGITIVDTPGLDDVVIQREEISKEYMSTCDLMIHLMNASQSATQKDIDFIIDTLLYQNVGKLLIVLTKIDNLSDTELQEVIGYTQKSIKAQLGIRNESSKLDFILDNLKFIEVSSKMALLHKQGKEDEALKEGYSLEKTGILKLEDYLYETLYGENSQKSDLIISSTKGKVFKSIQIQMSSLEYELKLLSKNEDEIAEELEMLKRNKDTNAQNISHMKEELLLNKDELSSYSKGLDSFVQAQLFRAKNRLCSRLMDDFTYAVEQKKTKEFLRTLNFTLDLALKDTLIDLLRDYRYKFIQQSQSLGAKMQEHYESYKVLQIQMQENSTLDSVNTHFKTGFIHSSSTLLSATLTKAFKKANVKDLSALEIEVQGSLNEAYEYLHEEISFKAHDIVKGLIEELYEDL